LQDFFLQKSDNSATLKSDSGSLKVIETDSI